MGNPRDTGRYDAIEQDYIDQQVRIDFAWGNIPMQPNDDRDEPLDPELDSHIIATSGYQNFPAFTRGGIFDDTDANISVPNLVGLANPTAALEALENVGLVLGDTNSSQVGANSGNNGTVKSQSPVAGTLVNEGDSVDIVVYDNPQVTVPNLAGQTQSAVNSLLSSNNLISGTVTTSTTGATSSNWSTVKSQSPAAGSLVAPGSAVNYVFYDYVSTATTGAISGFTRNAIAALGGSLNGDQAIMYVTGRSTWPAVGSTIVVTGTTTTAYNTTYTVAAVAADDAYNTGGTAIKVTRAAGGSFNGANTSSSGTWAFPLAPLSRTVYTSGPIQTVSANGNQITITGTQAGDAIFAMHNATGAGPIGSGGTVFRVTFTGTAMDGTYQIDAYNGVSGASSSITATATGIGVIAANGTTVNAGYTGTFVVTAP